MAYYMKLIEKQFHNKYVQTADDDEDELNSDDKKIDPNDMDTLSLVSDQKKQTEDEKIDE